MVLPTMVAPASDNLRTTVAVDFGAGCASSHSGLPPPVRKPAMSYMSLTARVRPAKGPEAAPATGAGRSCGTNADCALDISPPRVRYARAPACARYQSRILAPSQATTTVVGKDFLERAPDMGDAVRHAGEIGMT